MPQPTRDYRSARVCSQQLSPPNPYQNCEAGGGLAFDLCPGCCRRAAAQQVVVGLAAHTGQQPALRAMVETCHQVLSGAAGGKLRNAPERWVLSRDLPQT